MNRLRQLNDRVVRKLSHHSFAKRLMARPEIAEVSAAREKNGSRGKRAPQQTLVERALIAGIYRTIESQGREARERPEPDRAVAWIPVVRKVEQSNGTRGHDASHLGL